MNKANFKLLIVASLIILTSCTGNSIKEPEQIGRYVFKMLKNLSAKSKSDYVGNFPSIEEIKELGRNEQVVTDEETRNDLTSISKEEVVDEIERNYNCIKEKGGEYGINWQEIEYLDFVYNVKIGSDGLKGCRGTLYFKYSDKSYKIEIVSIFNGTGYYLSWITNLYLTTEDDETFDTPLI